jgi:hypothetical protein
MTLGGEDDPSAQRAVVRCLLARVQRRLHPCWGVATMPASPASSRSSGARVSTATRARSSLDEQSVSLAQQHDLADV